MQAPTLPLPARQERACRVASQGSSFATTLSSSRWSIDESPLGSEWSPIASEAESKPRAMLLGRECRFAAVPAPAFKVKNTFIDDLCDEDECGDSQPLVGKSCSCPACFTGGHESSESEDEAVAVEIEPSALRRPTMSLGAAFHGTGLCKPCGWYWRPQGCSNGANCRHCHLCDVSAVRARKKKALKASKIARFQCQGRQVRERRFRAGGWAN